MTQVVTAGYEPKIDKDPASVSETIILTTDKDTKRGSGDSYWSHIRMEITERWVRSGSILDGIYVCVCVYLGVYKCIYLTYFIHVYMYIRICHIYTYTFINTYHAIFNFHAEKYALMNVPTNRPV